MAISELPARPREILERFYNLNQSVAEIGLATGSSDAAVKQALYRCRQRIAAAMRRQGLDEPW